MGVFVFLRHGQTDGNKDQIFNGHTDAPLNEEGYKEAVKAARNLKQTAFDAVYSSPLIRAKNTARIVMEENARPTDIFYIEGLKEIFFGDWEGLKTDDIKKAYPEQWVQYKENYTGFAFPGGESVPAYFERIRNYMLGLKKRHPQGNILIVSHKGFILPAISCLLHGGCGEMRKYDIRTGKTAAVECFEAYNMLISLNC